MNEQNTSTITLGELFNAIFKNKLLGIIITLVLTFMGGMYAFYFAEEEYKASSTVIVAITDDNNDNKLDYNNSLKLISTVKELIKQDIVLDDVANKHNINSSTLSNSINIATNDKSYLITVEVTNTNKDLAKDLANDLVAELIHEVNNNDVLGVLKGVVKQTSKAKEGKYASPNKPLILIISFVLGGVLSLITIFVKEFASNKFKNKKEIENELSDKIVGVFFNNPDKEAKKDGNKIVELVEPSIKAFESYNILLSNIKYSNLENPYKVIMISSTAKNELKSSICSNLAYCMVNNNKKAIIIDFDTRKPVIHKVFKTTKENGLVDYIEGEITKEELIKHTDSGVDIITVGKKVINPMVIIDATKVKELIETLREEYDYILLDTPPMLAGADGIEVSKLADGVIFNVGLEVARKSDIKASLKALNEVNANVIGINLTKVKLSKIDKEYYYYED